MNKTVNINLGGLFFHIDEDAFQKLNRYFDAIKRSLSNSNGQDEIMKDIEMRISEIFSENQKSEKHVISLKDVDAMIAVMGQPEDYRIEEEDASNPTQNQAGYKNARTSKKLYRDIDKNILGGVAAGFGHYMGIDALWIRLILVLIVIAGVGFPIFLYILLWVLIPKALTTTEKLEMTGEPVTLSNIEKKVREEYENNPDLKEGTDSVKNSNSVKSGAERIGTNIGEIFMTLFSLFAKFIGAIIIIFSILVLGSLLIGSFTFGTTTFVEMPWQAYYDAVIVSEFPIGLVILLSFFAIGIPFFFLLILGLKLIITNMKSIGNIAKYTLLALWIISVGILISFGIKQATEVAYSGKVSVKENLNLIPNDTLMISFKYNDFYAKDLYHYNDFEVTQDENENTVIYSNDVRIEIKYTEEPVASIQVERKAEGKSMKEAKKRAEKIKYQYTIDSNKLIFDNYFVTDLKNKFRNQEVDIYLYLPKGTYFKTDSSFKEFDRSDNSFFNLHFSSDHYIYQVKDRKVYCINCPSEENEYEDIELKFEDSTSTSVTINRNGIQIQEKDNSTTQKEFKGLEINKEGVIIKTNNP
ncbi:PspC domain-containing protein [Flavobacterium sp.]|uniref:PspC domain-containing protein n=1 Tax=Flavobacterium sp. TaxID=239 RepID=UPI002FD947E1